MKNRQLDATLQSAGLGVASIRDLAASVPITVVAVPADLVEKVGLTLRRRDHPGRNLQRPGRGRPDGGRGQFPRHPQRRLGRSRLRDDQAALGESGRAAGRARGRQGHQARAARRGCRCRCIRAPRGTTGKRGCCRSARVPRAADRRPRRSRRPATLIGAQPPTRSGETIAASPGAGPAAGCSSPSRSPSPLSSSGPRPTARCRARSCGRCMSASCCCWPSASVANGRRAPRRRGSGSTGRWGCWPSRSGSITGSFYEALILRAGDPTATDIVVGVLAVGAGVRGRAGALMGASLPIICGRLPRLRPVRPVSAVAARPSRLRFRAGGRPDVLRHRGHLRHPDLRLLELHLPVHPVRRLPRARRHDPAVHRRVAGPGRPQPRRAGQGRGDLVRPDGHDQRHRASPTSSPPASSPSR